MNHTIMATSQAASQCTGLFVVASVDCGWHDGWTNDVYRIVGTTNSNGHWILQSKTGEHTAVSPVNIKAETLFSGARPAYANGTLVRARIPAAHWRADDTIVEGTIKSVRVFGNDVDYTVILADGTSHDFSEKHGIVCKIDRFTPVQQSPAQQIAQAEELLLRRLAALRFM